jgi:hypothetical protein
LRKRLPNGLSGQPGRLLVTKHSTVEGAGGNRDFDGGKATPRGQGSGLDQEDSATGTYDFAIRAAPVVV